MKPSKIVSGGQTGADRAALDAAMALGIAHGGWAPLDRWAEDGPIAPCYQLREAPSGDVTVRTAWNVRDSDATLILSHGRLRGGSRLTRDLARAEGKPVLHIDLERFDAEAAASKLRDWLQEVQPAVLNVAGPRASSDPRIYHKTLELLTCVLSADASAE